MGKKRKIALYGLLHLAVLFTILYLAMNTLFAQTSTIEIQFPLSQEYQDQITYINYSLDSQINFSSCWAMNLEEQTQIFQAGDLITGLSSTIGINNWILICNDTESNLHQKEIIFSSIFNEEEILENETLENQTPEQNIQPLELEILSPINSQYNSSQILLEINFSNNTKKWIYELSNLGSQEFNSSIKQTTLTRLKTGDYNLTITIFDEFENSLTEFLEFQIDFEDLDRDSILDLEDNLILSNELIQTNFDLTIKVNNESEIPALLEENETLIEFYDGSDLILSILIQDLNETISFENFSLEKDEITFSLNSFEYEKTIYFEKLDKDLIGICLIFREDISSNSITNKCSRDWEINFKECIENSHSSNGIDCKDLGNGFEFQGDFSTLKAKFLYSEEEVQTEKKEVVKEESFKEVFFNDFSNQEDSVLEIEEVSENFEESNENVEEDKVKETTSKNIVTGKVIEKIEQFYISTDKKWILITLISLGLIGVFSVIGFRKKKVKETVVTKTSSQNIKEFDEKFKAI